MHTFMNEISDQFLYLNNKVLIIVRCDFNYLHFEFGIYIYIYGARYR